MTEGSVAVTLKKSLSDREESCPVSAVPVTTESAVWIVLLLSVSALLVDDIVVLTERLY